ncbi:glycosyltransferase family 4 protein [Listeria booriae]|uniref:Glycosyltransferase family 4 protein n=1 Tax=Listeria booriae TaxID=1552123 RepID=A0A842G2P8_9LIST|nr:glycosyltransferase family 4 protein [Listeria booriae]MBC2285014.1 glycosyltransferase family 4 protein [Listeria booriae]MBC2292776.1 glycosyltransferase family 4 protein [Listeria booriae]MBC2676157.1 glycosyltransferase family 4 protein [Listeria booriae]
MNILMVGPGSDEKGGIATVIANFKQFYQFSNHHVFFLSSWSERAAKRTSIYAFFQLRRIIREKQIDIVHFHVAQKGSFFRKALLAKIVPKQCQVIFHMHASQFDLFYEKSHSIVQRMIRKTLNDVNQLVVLGDNWANFYRSITTTPISIIQNAVSIPEKSLFNLKSKKIVTFGRIGQRKGSYDLLEIAKNIQNFFPDVQFVLYGDGEVEKIAEKIEEEGIQNVCLGGWINKVTQQEVLKDTILHFLPSYHEGLPMAILESMAAGIPNLTTNVGGILEAVHHEKNGMVANPGSINEMTQMIQQFLEDEARQLTYSHQARKTIETQFSMNHYLTQWYQFYNRISK